MKTKPGIVANWLPRHIGTPLKDFGKHSRLVSFTHFDRDFTKGQGLWLGPLG